MLLSLANSWHSDKQKERSWHIIGPMIPACVGVIIPLATTSVAARYVGIFLMVRLFTDCETSCMTDRDTTDGSICLVYSAIELASSLLSIAPKEKSSRRRFLGCILEYSQHCRVGLNRLEPTMPITADTWVL